MMSIFKSKKKCEIDPSREPLSKSDWPDGIINLSNDNFDEFINKYPLSIIDFSAEWCGPCKAMYPVIRQLSKEYKGRVDMTLLLPKKTKLTATTTSGNILVRMKGAVNIDTDSGNLSVNTTGHIQAKTNSGTITAWIKGMICSQPMHMESDTGNISVMNEVFPLDSVRI